MRIDEKRSTEGPKWYRIAYPGQGGCWCYTECEFANDDHARRFVGPKGRFEAFEPQSLRKRMEARKLAAALPTLTNASPAQHAKVAARMVADMDAEGDISRRPKIGGVY